MKTLGWLFGLDEVTSIEQWKVSFAAWWAQDSLFWIFLGSAFLLVLAVVFYLRFQPRGTRSSRLGLGLCRGLILILLFITLANPVYQITATNYLQPLLYVLFDGTDSMAIEDTWTDSQREELTSAVQPAKFEQSTDTPQLASRLDYVQAYLRREDNVLTRLQDEKAVRLQAYIFDGNSTSQLRRLNAAEAEKLDAASLAGQLTAKGQVTAIGAALDDVSRQFGAGQLAGLVFVSDFGQNSGTAPLAEGARSPVTQLGVPVFTVGVGATEAVDLAVDMQTDPKMKRAERTDVLVKLRQTGLQGSAVSVHVTAQRQTGQFGEVAEPIEVGRRQVTLASNVESVEFPFTPKEAGRFEFVAEVEPLEGELVDENNRVAREVNIIDDYLRLMYVDYEPSWEWRFVKEVFHRDKLVGMEGFRTYLASSAPRVRENNVLFLPTLTPKRSEFFSTDVIFLGDMPQTSLNNRFCEMVQQYVGQLGGGLVVIAGPRFGPGQLQGTPIADMLPVIVDPTETLRDDREFQTVLTAHADRYSFMKLGENDVENNNAWASLGRMQWYQPVSALHEQAYALAEHPLDTCSDGKTPQPLIAIRKYGKGEVVYIAHNEMWRLRRKYGEKYYRTFWSQLIYRLGMSHALGDDKRFVPRLDRRQYRMEDKVTFTVEAYNEDYEPLTETDLPGLALTAEITMPTGQGDERTQAITVPQLRSGVFEARIPVYAAGEYTLRVKDPVTGDFQERRFEVTNVPAERLRGVRDVQLQESIARESRGRSYDLTNVSNLLNDVNLKPIAETQTRNFPLWCTPFWFGLLACLMLGEWFCRKMVNMR